MGVWSSDGQKEGDQLRFCCDVRYLNSVTVKDAYPIPSFDESLSKLGDAKFFTTLDLGSAFWQVPLRKQDRDKTETDAVWSLQCHCHISAVDGTRADRCDEEVRQSGNVLCG